MKRILLLLLLLYFSYPVFAQKGEKLSREDYIGTYKDLAIKEMSRSGVPASITLAQGMLESDNGNSRLAVKANNHFGIKCHSSWKGRKIYHDDDERNECFRKYKSAYDSYIDHSDFLTNVSRYDFLFDFKQTDYKSWAKGLKSAGYATSNKYDKLLIRIIEENELHQYDLAMKTEKKKRDSRKSHDKTTGRTILSNNRIDYIVVEEGDNSESLGKEFSSLRLKLLKYNELSSDSKLFSGQILYLQPKRNKAEAGKNTHIYTDGESMHLISQKYGIKLNKLYHKNHWESGYEPDAGTEIMLRKSKSGRFKMKMPKIEEEKDEESLELKFEFDGGR